MAQHRERVTLEGAAIHRHHAALGGQTSVRQGGNIGIAPQPRRRQGRIEQQGKRRTGDTREGVGRFDVGDFIDVIH